MVLCKLLIFNHNTTFFKDAAPHPPSTDDHVVEILMHDLLFTGLTTDVNERHMIS